MHGPFSAVRPRRRRFIALLIVVAVSVPAWSSPAAASHTVTCRSDGPTKPGQTMTWRATPSGGSGNYAYTWTGTDGLSGTAAVVSKSYATHGWKVGNVTVRDQQSGHDASTDCGMPVVPTTLSEAPSVIPVLWVPKGSIDPTPLVPQLNRVMRSIRAEYFHMYGKTFDLKPIHTILSTQSEFDVCGGDCTDQGNADPLMYNAAMAEARAAVGVIPFERAVIVMAWGTGGFAGAWGWDIALGGVGDWTFAGPAGLKVPHLEAGYDTPEWVVDLLDEYQRPIACALAHELNHSIGWDDPHDFCLGSPPTDYERHVVASSPWMTVTPADTLRPSVSVTSPAEATVVTGNATINVSASDAGGMDAVVLLVDGHYVDLDTTAPFSFTVDTTKLNFGSRRFTAIAYDMAGNTSEASRHLVVRNTISGSSCAGTFPVGVFHACFYDGIGTGGPYLGTLLDVPAWYSDNVALAVNHGFGDGVAFGQTETFSGVWRGQLDLPAGNYRLRFNTDDGLRVRVNGSLVLDAWLDQVGYYEVILALSGLTSFQLDWYENGGSEGLRFIFGPTLNPPPGKFTVVADIEGRGAVTSSPAGINCGLGLDCYESFTSGQAVTLTATPQQGATFNGWSGDADCADGVVTANSNKRCLARFEGGGQTGPRCPGTECPPADFTGDRRTDISVFRPSSGAWMVSGQAGAAVFLGASGDIPVPCDFTGDGKTDQAVFRPAVGGWYVNGQSPVFFGLPGDIPVPADYDGDGRCDIALFRPSVGGWYRAGAATTFFGLGGDIPVPGDYDGNGTADIAIFRPAVGGWYRHGAATTFFGLGGDTPVPGDYDGNGTADIAIFRPTVGGWYRHGAGVTFFGFGGDIPQPGDYDGNRTTDVAVFRPSTGQWFVQGQGPVSFGVSTDIPLPLPAAIRLATTGVALDVNSTLGWVDTPLTLTAGGSFAVSYLSGSWSVDQNNFGFVGPDGYPPGVDATIFQGCKLDPSIVYGKLVGSIGGGAVFAVRGPGAPSPQARAARCACASTTATRVWATTPASSGWRCRPDRARSGAAGLVAVDVGDDHRHL